jgi:crossover junction endodeoxyribonuclease RusA
MRQKHWSSRAEAARNYRALARILTHPYAQGGREIITPCPVKYIFCKPDKRNRDMNGCYGAVKAGEDGIADALGIDDKWFYPVTLDWGEIVPGGAVVVEVGG